MEIRVPHPWPRGQSEALNIQYQFKDRVILNGSLSETRLVAGIDTAFDHRTDMLFAAVCVFTYPDMEEQERATASAKAEFEYVPGLHAFREGPVILLALARLKTRPDLIIFSSHGIAHPRRFGLASHLGVILDIPTIGCARKRLAGNHEEVASHRGASSPLVLDHQQVGTVYRTRDNVKPVFISPGHKCAVDDAAQMVINCLRGFRVPAPLQAAHRLANRMKNNNKKPT